MTNVRVMFIGQGASGIPEDRIVNTFHFSGTDTYASMSVAAMQRVADFYLDDGVAGPLQQVNTISAYLSPWINREAEIRVYDLGDAKPRVPVITPITLSTAFSAQGLPEEVALCLSYNGAAPNTKRRRGRIYIGPLVTGANLGGGGSALGPTRPAVDFVADLCKAAQTLAAKSTAALSWVIRSSIPSENFVGITHGYVDNAWDTQRRRGPETTARSEWTVPAL